MLYICICKNKLTKIEQNLFEDYLKLKMEKIIADIEKDNYNSIKLLDSLNFINKIDDYIYSVNRNFYELSEEMYNDFKK